MNAQHMPEGFEPVHSAHSIEQVVFVFSIDRTLNDAQYVRMQSAMDEFKDSLPGRSDIQAMAFSFGGGQPGFLPPGFVAPPQQQNGVRRSLTNPDGSLAKELVADRGSVTYRSTQYSRWAEVWKEASSYFATLAPIYVSDGAAIASIVLHICDKFVYQGKPTKNMAALLLKKDSQYLSLHIFDTDELWHSHTGAFVRADNNTKRLINLNVDCLDEPYMNGARRVVAINTVLTDMFNQPGYAQSAAESKEAFACLDAHMAELHASNKNILASVLNDNMAKRIALF